MSDLPPLSPAIIIVLLLIVIYQLHGLAEDMELVLLTVDQIDRHTIESLDHLHAR